MDGREVRIKWSGFDDKNFVADGVAHAEGMLETSREQEKESLELVEKVIK